MTTGKSFKGDGSACRTGGHDQVVPFDPRLRAAIWSWTPGEPNNWNGVEHCAQQAANGRFNDLDRHALCPFACLNEQTREWRVTQGAGSGQQGDSTCEAEFGTGNPVVWRKPCNDQGKCLDRPLRRLGGSGAGQPASMLDLGCPPAVTRSS